MIVAALRAICEHGDENHRRCAQFVLNAPVYVDVDDSTESSGGAGIFDSEGANRAIRRGVVSLEDAAKFIHLTISRNTIRNGAVDLEGTLVHETQHVENDARTIHTLSLGDRNQIYNPTQFENELSAHITSANYLKMRGGEYAEMGLNLDLLKQDNKGEFEVNERGIAERLKNCYVVKNTNAPLTAETPGVTTQQATSPPLVSRAEA